MFSCFHLVTIIRNLLREYSEEIFHLLAKPGAAFGMGREATASAAVFVVGLATSGNTLFEVPVLRAEQDAARQ